MNCFLAVTRENREMTFLLLHLNSLIHSPINFSHGPPVYPHTFLPAYFHFFSKLISTMSNLIPTARNTSDGGFLPSSWKIYSQVTLNFGAKKVIIMVIIMVSSHWMQIHPFISISVAKLINFLKPVQASPLLPTL